MCLRRWYAACCKARSALKSSNSDPRTVYCGPQKKVMFNIILFGPPGSGKGTQAKQLSSDFDLLHISTGDLFRSEIGNQTELGKEAKGYMDAGDLVPDELVLRMLKNAVAQHPDINGVIYDGFPRTVVQAEALNEMLHQDGERVNILIALAVDEEEIVQRILERSKTSGRADDANEETVRARIKVYKEQTTPVYHFYEKLGNAYEVDGMGSIEEVYARLAGLIRTAQ